MKKTIAVINRMVEEGIIENYAVGGGIAAMFYIEPELTFDIDFFTIVEHEKERGIVDLSRIYDFLKKEGYTRDGEHIVVEGVPVQFICADALESEAVKNAREITYEGVETRVIDREYLAAIFVRVGRGKDRERIRKMLAQPEVNKEKFDRIITRYGLKEKLSGIFSS